MYINHEFAHSATLARAAHWLLQLGFRRDELEIINEGTPRIAVSSTAPRLAAASRILNALKEYDVPGAFPGFDDIDPTSIGLDPAPENGDAAGKPVAEASGAAISIRPEVDATIDDPEVHRMAEAVERLTRSDRGGPD